MHNAMEVWPCVNGKKSDGAKNILLGGPSPDGRDSVTEYRQTLDACQSHN